jgi:hypothetical protein
MLARGSSRRTARERGSATDGSTKAGAFQRSMIAGRADLGEDTLAQWNEHCGLVGLPCTYTSNQVASRGNGRDRIF